MRNERKILYLSVVICFAVGIILGVILFFGQVRSGAGFPQNMYEYEKDVNLTDFIRMAWIMMMWILSTVAAYGILRIRYIHPVIIIRGCISSFSALYVLHLFGVKEAIISILPQCLSTLPILMMFSAETLMYKTDGTSGRSGIIIKKSEIIVMFTLSVLSAGAEIIIFKTFCLYLF